MVGRGGRARQASPTRRDRLRPADDRDRVEPLRRLGSLHGLATVIALGACTFGVDGRFVETEAGFVSVEALLLDTSSASGAAGGFEATSVGRDLVVAFEVDGVPGELKIRDVSALLDQGGAGTLRFYGEDGWSEARPVKLELSSVTRVPMEGLRRRDISVTLAAAGAHKAASIEPDEDEDEGDGDGETDPLGSLSIILVDEWHC